MGAEIPPKIIKENKMEKTKIKNNKSFEVTIFYIIRIFTQKSILRNQYTVLDLGHPNIITPYHLVNRLKTRTIT